MGFQCITENLKHTFIQDRDFFLGGGRKATKTDHVKFLKSGSCEIF